LFLLGLGSNAVGSAFNFLYNKFLIVDRMLPGQQAGFWDVVAPLYNAVAYPLCLVLIFWQLGPVARCRRELIDGRPVEPSRLLRCRRLLINLPCSLVAISLLGWLPGAVVFPLGVCLTGGWDWGAALFGLFSVSFGVSALLTALQTYFLLEGFLTRFVYAEFFRDARPADIPRTVQLTLRVRLVLFWVAVSVVPLTALLAVVLTFAGEWGGELSVLRNLAVGVAVAALVNAGAMSYLVGSNLLGWVSAHAAAMSEIARKNYDYRIGLQRPDELGRLTDRFNDMADQLGRASRLSETFGEFLNPEVRDEVLANYPGLEGEVREVTVLFLDIRGFTKRSAGAAPERVVALLNRFLSLAVAAVEQGGGWVNKFLGDGLMALFGSPRPRADHADLAAGAATALLERLAALNRQLAAEGEAPLAVSIGMHTGPALVGCVGAELTHPDGRRQMRREFTAIGETVNLAARVEQLTKSAGGPVLITDALRRRLTHPFGLSCVGARLVAGFEEPVTVYRLEAPPAAPAGASSTRRTVPGRAERRP
jgi:adenylate cyclase